MKTFIKFLMTIILLINGLGSFANEKINVVYTIDNNYPIFTLISINSILLNNKSESNYKFYIIEDNLSKQNKQMMEKFVLKRNQEIEFIKINSPIITQNPNAYVLITHITPIALARIFIPDLLPKTENKALYIDADTIAISDIKQLYNINLDNNVAGMVKNIAQSIISKDLYTFENDYYNSGVILIDLKKAREENSSKEFENFYIKNYEKFVPKNSQTKAYFAYPDQDLINIVWDGKIKKLNSKWNQQQLNISQEGIIHYIGKSKPWLFPAKKRNLQSHKLYFAIWDQTPELKIYKHKYILKSIFKDYENSVKKKIKYHKETLNFILFNKY